MTPILLDLLAIVAFFFILKIIFKRRIDPYDTKFWSIVQSIWLISSFAGVSLGLYEVHRVKEQADYLEKEEKLIEEFDSVKIAIYGETELMHTDSTVKPNVRESIQWFYKMAGFLEEGYEDNKWRRFVNYTRRFVFNETSVIKQPNDNALFFDWPKDATLLPADIVHKPEMRKTVDKLVKFKTDIDALATIKPRRKPELIARYVFIMFFTVAFALKLLRTYAEYFK